MKKSLWWGGLLLSAGMFLGSVVVPAVTGARAAQGGKPQIPKVLRAQSFEVVDAKGNARAVLAVLSDGSPEVTLYDEKRNLRVGLTVAKDRPLLSLYDEKRNGRAILTLLPDGRPGLMLADEKGGARASLALEADGSPGLALADEKRKTRAELGLKADGSPGLMLADKKGKVIWKAPPEP